MQISTKGSPRVFVVGCPGSGKTTLARLLSSHFEVGLRELDFIAWDEGGSLLPYETRVKIATDLAAKNSWVVEGPYLGWTTPFIERAHIVVWMDVPMSVALWRVFWRHLRAEVSRDNRFPDWINLFRFMRVVVAQYRDRFDRYGPPDIPIGPNAIERQLRPHHEKVIKGSGRDALNAVLATLEQRQVS